MLQTDLSFLTKIPDSVGYLVVQDGAIYKSDGDLVNADRVAQLAQRIVRVGGPDALVNGERFNEITVHYPDHFYSICCNNNLVFVVKRKSEGS